MVLKHIFFWQTTRGKSLLPLLLPAKKKIRSVAGIKKFITIYGDLIYPKERILDNIYKDLAYKVGSHDAGFTRNIHDMWLPTKFIINNYSNKF